jgi:hypothetical protein
MGSAKYFWSGVDDEDNQHICQCGIDGNCVDPELKCNCDSMNPVQLSDSGMLIVVFSLNPFELIRKNVRRGHNRQKSFAHHGPEFWSDSTGNFFRSPHAG